MGLSSVFLIIAVSTALAGSVTLRSLVFNEEATHSYVEMTPLKPLDLSAFTLCMNVVTELKGQREIILFAYRTQDFDELNVWREKDGRLSFYLAGEGVLFEIPAQGAINSHLCATWDSSTGEAVMFIDGRRTLTKIYKKGHRVRPRGKVILGQDPDSFLGDFEPDQRFIGEISDVNMWDSVLLDREIQNLIDKKRVQRGNVFDWESADLTVVGEVTIINREL